MEVNTLQASRRGRRATSGVIPDQATLIFVPPGLIEHPEIEVFDAVLACAVGLLDGSRYLYA